MNLIFLVFCMFVTSAALTVRVFNIFERSSFLSGACKFLYKNYENLLVSLMNSIVCFHMYVMEFNVERSFKVCGFSRMIVSN